MNLCKDWCADGIVETNSDGNRLAAAYSLHNDTSNKTQAIYINNMVYEGSKSSLNVGLFVRSIGDNG